MRTGTIAGRRGFTLIDMVLVIAILSVLGAIAFPRYSMALSRYRAAAAAQRIAADLALAQSVAKTTSAGQVVSFNVSGNNYQLPGYAGPLGGTAQANYTTDLSVDPYQSTLVSASFNTLTQVTFDRFGQPDNGGTIVVQCGGIQKMITVSASTGKVSVQ